MKAIILAAGRGVRMLPLTHEKPKPLLEWRGKTLIEHAINVLPDEVNEVVVVIGYLKDQFIEFFKSNDFGKKITLIVQDEIAGTAPALMLGRKYLENDKFIVMYADDIHDEEAVRNLLDYDLSLLTTVVEDARPYGVVEKDNKNVIKAIVEKPERPKTNEVAVGVYLLDGRIFKYFDSERKNMKEYYLTDMIGLLICDYPIRAVSTGYWKKITTPEDLIDGN